MKRRWWILIVVAVIAAGWFFFGHSREPMHDGKPVSYWFKEYYSRYEGGHTHHTDDEINLAIAALGTNALPYLVREALSTRQDSGWRSNYYALLEKLPESWNAPRFISLNDIRDDAISAIGDIDPPPEVILPMVRKALDSPNPLLHRQALKILNELVDGEEDRERLLAPYFIPALRLADRESRHLAIEFLNGIGAPARPAVPDLIPLLDDQHGVDALYLTAAATLGSLGADAKEALPKLQSVFNQESNLWARFDLAVALLRIDAGQTAAMDYLQAKLKDTTPRESSSAPTASETTFSARIQDIEGVNYARLLPPETFDSQRPLWSMVAADRLGQVGTNAQAAVPALVEAMRETNAAVVGASAKALRLIGARKELFLPILRERLKSDDEATRLAAARELLANEPADLEAQGVLVDLIQRNSTYALVAIYWLRIMGPSAKEAIPVLEKALKSGDVRIRKAAESALDWIKQQENRPK